MTARSDIEHELRGILKPRFIELWWDLKLPGLGMETPRHVFGQDPARLLEYVKAYKDPAFT